jgi:hypothetical protein
VVNVQIGVDEMLSDWDELVMLRVVSSKVEKSVSAIDASGIHVHTGTDELFDGPNQLVSFVVSTKEDKRSASETVNNFKIHLIVEEDLQGQDKVTMQVLLTEEGKQRVPQGKKTVFCCQPVDIRTVLDEQFHDADKIRHRLA